MVNYVELELKVIVTKMLVASGYAAWLLTYEGHNEVVWAKGIDEVVGYKGGSVHKLHLPKNFTAERSHTYIIDVVDGGIINHPLW